MPKFFEDSTPVPSWRDSASRQKPYPLQSRRDGQPAKKDGDPRPLSEQRRGWILEKNPQPAAANAAHRAEALEKPDVDPTVKRNREKDIAE